MKNVSKLLFGSHATIMMRTVAAVRAIRVRGGRLVAKGALLRCRLPSFTGQKAMFCMERMNVSCS